MSIGSRPLLVAYIRVSTDRQAEEGHGLDVQREAITQWARSNGYRITAFLADEGISGSNGLAAREALADAFDLVRRRKAVGLVVYRLDRLARDLVVQETLLAEIWRMGAEVFSTSSAEAGYLSDDPDDPSRTLIRQVLGAVSQYERSMIALRLRSGRRRKAETGGFAYGSPPLGYRAEGKTLVHDPVEQEVLARVRGLRDDGLSLRGIASALNANGLRTKRGASWHPTTVARALKSPELPSPPRRKQARRLASRH
jgi:DNA invertase Pin-like site-specific DNA recombinase